MNGCFSVTPLSPLLSLFALPASSSSPFPPRPLCPLPSSPFALFALPASPSASVFSLLTACCSSSGRSPDFIYISVRSSRRRLFWRRKRGPENRNKQFFLANGVMDLEEGFAERFVSSIISRLWLQMRSFGFPTAPISKWDTTACRWALRPSSPLLALPASLSLQPCKRVAVMFVSLLADLCSVCPRVLFLFAQQRLRRLHSSWLCACLLCCCFLCRCVVEFRFESFQSGKFLSPMRWENIRLQLADIRRLQSCVSHVYSKNTPRSKKNGFY